uniref:Cadherin domain-containing protein n=1 Tax=Sander lucioperca TaxID=283035 RepID=A0A8C9Z9J3_SANLU
MADMINRAVSERDHKNNLLGNEWNNSGLWCFVQIRSTAHSVNKIFYSITGPGADQPPVGLFTMDRSTGNLYLTQPLDREEKDSYMVTHAVAEGSENAEAPMDITVKVIDQNDNKPTFNQSTFLGEVAEASPKGTVIKVVATDIDQPNTDNSDIRYRLISQEPTLPSDFMFVINPVTGVIRVNASGLDREVRLLKQIVLVFACFPPIEMKKIKLLFLLGYCVRLCVAC